MKEGVFTNSCLFSGQKPHDSKMCWVGGCLVCVGMSAVSVAGGGGAEGEALIGDAVCLHGG